MQNIHHPFGNWEDLIQIIVLIKVNKTIDVCILLEFLDVGLKQQFFPPIQVSFIDFRYWKRRGSDNELESNQVRVSSLIILNHTENISKEKLIELNTDIKKLIPVL